MPPKNIYSILCFLLLFSVAKAQINLGVASIPDSLMKDANSVVRYDSRTIEYKKNQLLETHKYAITVLNKKHEDQLVFAKSFQDKSMKVKDVSIKLYDRNGTEIKDVKRKEIDNFAAHTIEFVTDQRILFYKYQANEYPVTIEVSYTTKNKDPYYVSSWYPVDIFRQSVQSRMVTLIDEAGEFEYKEREVGKYRILTEDGTSYHAKNILPYRKEKNMPPVSVCFPVLNVALNKLNYHGHEGKVKTWNEFGKWAYESMFIPKRDVDKEQLLADTYEIVSNAKTDLEKAELLFKYVQNTTRYVLISLEDGGWSPLPISTVHDKKFGDCKALSFYYNTLCNAHGLPAELVLVNAGKEGLNADSVFYSTSQFNHVISRLSIDDKHYWVDCTSNVNPFNFLGSFSDDRLGLLLNPKIGQVIKTPEYPNHHKSRTEIVFSDNKVGNATVIKETIGIGVDTKLLQITRMSKQEKLDYTVDKITKKYNDASISASKIEFDTTNLTFREIYQVEMKNELEVLGDYYQY